MLTIHAKNAATFLEKSKGLLGEKSPFAIFFQTRWGIHTFGMAFPIDVLILNEANSIVALKKHLKTNHIFLWNPRYKKVLELPSGTIQKEKLEKGTKITLVLD